jgi:hypothetical protein
MPFAQTNGMVGLLTESLSISLLVDNQPPGAALWRSGSEVLGIKGKDGKVMALGVSHHR